ncbi:MAG: 3-phosphoshikimate 1-carboxyvinyltransferase [Deltaproteobacteria bacterium]|nr:MAG: 3-phosphoshikimate 1-carboxyvinyltransferase [Deltaproteobacteria bacterium]
MSDLSILIRSSKFEPNFTLVVPPSKSETHRALICAALAAGAVRVEHPLLCEDTEATLDALGRMGASWQISEEAITFGEGSIVERIPALAHIDCASSASTLRMLLPIAAVCGGRIHFSGRPDLARRPIVPLLEVLRSKGARIHGTSLPLTVEGGFVGGEIEIPADITSQFLSGLLFALPLTPRGGTLRLPTPPVSRPYLALTLEFLERCGVEVTRAPRGDTLTVPGGQRFEAPPRLSISGDWSAAAVWLAGGVLAGPQISLCGLTPRSTQGDRKIVPLLQAMGGRIEREEERLIARRTPLRGTTIDARDIPDLVPLLALVATQAQGTTRITHTKRLRWKESDRLRAICTMLARMGARIEVEDDALEVSGPAILQGARIDPAGDHRIVMTAAIAGMIAGGETHIAQPECVNKSYPDFFHDLRRSGAVVLSETAPIGRHFQVTLYGGSHERCVGVRIEGLPPNVTISYRAITADLDKRRPSGLLTTQRREPDPLLLRKGFVREGERLRTTGGRIEIEIPNLDGHDAPYIRLRHTPRPGHGDYTAWRKYGGAFDFRGGGFLSGRMTVGMVAAGAVARQILQGYGITIAAYVRQIADLRLPRIPTFEEARQATWKSPVRCPDPILSEKMASVVLAARREGDSLGGIVECQVHGLPIGIGEPIFHALDAVLAHYLFTIPAVKGVAFGAGFEAAARRGSENNDPYHLSPAGSVQLGSNHSGGVLGGISTGAPLIFQIAIKPTPSIPRPQASVDLREQRDTTIRVTGRHDPAVVLRVPVIVEAFTAAALLDLYLAARSPNPPSPSSTAL